MDTAHIAIPGVFWEYFRLTDVITGKDTSPAALELARACQTIPRTHGKTFTVPVLLTAETAPVLGAHVDTVLNGFKDVPNRRESQLYRTARVLRERLDTALEALAAPPRTIPAPGDVEFTRWRLMGPHARRGAAVAVSKAIRETTGLVPSPVSERGKRVNDLIVSGHSTGVTVSISTFDPKHYDTEATYRKVLEGLDSKGYVLAPRGVQRNADGEWAFVTVVGKR